MKTPKKSTRPSCLKTAAKTRECRICLTNSVNYKFIDDQLYENRQDSASLRTALQYVMGVEVILTSAIPSHICTICHGLLKLAYELKEQFIKSQEKLKDQFNTDLIVVKKEEPSVIPEEKSKSSPVELVIGDTKYDIKDIVIVEDKTDIKSNYRGFLDNLGTTITVSIVPKNNNFAYKNSSSAPNMSITKVSNSTLMDDTLIDKYILSYKQIEHSDLKPSKLEVEDIIWTDSSLIQSALGLQYKCKYCHKVYSTTTRLKNHLKICEKAGGPLFCTLCNKKFILKKYLVYHMKTTHWNSNVERQHKCTICNEVLRTSSMLSYHRLKHKEKRHICEVCGKGCYTKNAIDVHREVHDKGKTKVLCPICGRGFHYNAALKHHMRLHRDERKYHCKECDKKFFVASALRRHENIHNNRRPFQCELCDKTFWSKNACKRHQLLHQVQKPYSCEVCCKGFTTNYNKRMHMLTHPGTSEFKCDICDRCFLDEELLQMHIIKDGHSVAKLDKYEYQIVEGDELLTDLFGQGDSDNRDQFIEDADEDHEATYTLEEGIVEEDQYELGEMSEFI